MFQELPEPFAQRLQLGSPVLAFRLLNFFEEGEKVISVGVEVT